MHPLAPLDTEWVWFLALLVDKPGSVLLAFLNHLCRDVFAVSCVSMCALELGYSFGCLGKG